MLRSSEMQLVWKAIEKLEPEFREVLVLREMEGLSYKEIASVIESPLGTVMSRLSRAREYIRQCLGTDIRRGRGWQKEDRNAVSGQ